MTKHIVVSIHRDRWFWPKLSIVVETRVKSKAAAQAFIVSQVMAAYEKRSGKRWISCRVKDFRVVDELGLKRLQAAAKASATIRRRRGAKKAAATRAKLKAARIARTAPARAALAAKRDYYPATEGYAVASDGMVN